MNENNSSTERWRDPDAAPDLSKDGWPEKFAEARVQRGKQPMARPQEDSRPNEGQ